MALSGIYCIEDAKGKLYYGSAKSIKARFANHQSQLRKGIHKNPILQAAFNKYGEEYFSYYVVEIVIDLSKLVKREQWWIDSLRESGLPYYNVNILATSSLGRKLSEKQKNFISELNKGNKYWLGKTHTEEAKRKIAASKIGKPMSESAKQAQSERVKARWDIPDGFKNLALAQSGGKLYTFIDEQGNIYTDIYSLRQFAKKHSINQSQLSRLARGLRDSYKGFRLIKVDYVRKGKEDEPN